MESKNNKNCVLTIDIGNTNTKLVFFKANKFDITPISNKIINNIYFEKYYKNMNLSQFISQNLQKTDNLNIVISSVNNETEQKVNGLIDNLNKTLFSSQNQKKIKRIKIGHEKNLPFTFNYTPKTSYGQDRLAELFYCLKTEVPIIIIDIGTAITVDYIDRNNIYSGGVILPSINLMLKSLHQYTSLLPDINICEFSYNQIEDIIIKIENGILGFSTKENMIIGSFSSIVYNMIGFIKKIYLKEINYLSSKKKLNIIITINNKLKGLIVLIEKLLLLDEKIDSDLIYIKNEDFLVNKGLKLFYDYFYSSLLQ